MACIFFLLLLIMSNSQFYYYDPEFNIENSAGNMLFLLIADSVFSFTIIQKQGLKVMVWGENYKLEELAEPKLLKSIFTAKYAQVKIGVNARNFTIIPADLYAESDIRSYERWLAPVTGDSIMVNKLDADNYVIFKLNETLSKQIMTYFDLRNVVFSAKAWLSAVKTGKVTSQNLYAHVEGSMLQLLYLSDNKFRFYNHFECNNPDELMYFTVMTANQLGLNLDEISLILSGEISFSDKKIHRINDLLPKVYFNQTQIVTLPSGYLSHQILMLAGLTLCA